LLISTDNGYSWIRTSNVNHQYYDNIYTNSTGSIFILGSDSLSRSDDNGVTFSSTNNGLFGDLYSFYIGNNDHLFCGTSHGLYRSIDNGESWQPLLENIGIVNSVIQTNNGYVYFVKDNSVIYRSRQANAF